MSADTSRSKSKAKDLSDDSGKDERVDVRDRRKKRRSKGRVARFLFRPAQIINYNQYSTITTGAPVVVPQPTIIVPEPIQNIYYPSVKKQNDAFSLKMMIPDRLPGIETIMKLHMVPIDIVPRGNYPSLRIHASDN